VPPHNIEAEQAVIGSVLLAGQSAYDSAMEFLRGAEDFYREGHPTLWSTIGTMLTARRHVDYVTLSEELDRQGALEEVGGKGYVMLLADVVPTAANAGHYAEIVARKATRRRVIEAAAEMTGWAYAEQEVADEDLPDLSEKCIQAATASAATSASTWDPAGDAANRRLHAVYEHQQNGGGIIGIKTRLTAVNEILCGLQRSQLTIVAARPSMGKSIFAEDLGLGAAENGYTVGVFSLEMNDDMLADRRLSRDAKINSRKIQRANISPEEWERLTEATRHLYSLQLKSDYSSALTVAEMRRRARRLKTQFGGRLDVIVVDYLQLMAPGPTREERENKHIAVGNNAEALRNLAKELNCAMVVVSQLSRKCEMREDKRPMLSDLADSGAIEKHCDVACFLYRASYYDRKKEADDSDVPESATSYGGDMDEVEVIVGKNRQGPTGFIKLGFQPKFSRFVNLEENRSVF
jgi:replicative DNA helicase